MTTIQILLLILIFITGYVLSFIHGVSVGEKHGIKPNTIKLSKKIESIMGLIQNRKFKQARAELKQVHRDILDPK